MSVVWMGVAVVFFSTTVVLAYWSGYQRGWLAGTAEVLEDVYVNEGDADD